MARYRRCSVRLCLVPAGRASDGVDRAAGMARLGPNRVAGTALPARSRAIGAARRSGTHHALPRVDGSPSVARKCSVGDRSYCRDFETATRERSGKCTGRRSGSSPAWSDNYCGVIMRWWAGDAPTSNRSSRTWCRKPSRARSHRRHAGGTMGHATISLISETSPATSRSIISVARAFTCHSIACTWSRRCRRTI